MHGVNFTASMIIVFQLTIFNYFMFLNHQIDRKKVANCVNYEIKLKRSNLERNVKYFRFLTLFIVNTPHLPVNKNNIFDIFVLSIKIMRDSLHAQP